MRARFSRFERMALIASSILWFTTAAASKLVTPGYLFNSDPTCRQIGDTFYLFTTQDPFTVGFQQPNTFFRGMYAYHALTTRDFDHWTDHGSILTGRDVSWNAGAALWDGDAGIPANGRFYAYAPFRINSNTEENYGNYDIGVFSAEHIEGPYKDVHGGPMKNVDGSPLSGLSPTVITAKDGSPYLIWGAGDTEKHEAWLAPLKPNRVELAAAPRRLQVPEKDACGNLEYYESPLLFQARGKWYFTYVAYKEDKGPKCDPKGSYVQYVTSDSMWGPFDGPPKRLLNRAFTGEESTQQGVCSFRGDLYLAYHVAHEEKPPFDDHHRQVAVTRLVINSDGSLRPIDPATDPGVGTPGLSTLSLDAFAPRREAAEFHASQGVDSERDPSGEYRMMMSDGSWLRFNHVAFAGGARGFRAEVSPSRGASALEIRLDSVTRPRVGMLQVRGDQTPKSGRVVLSTALDTPVRGSHDVFLIAHGRDTQKAALFGLSWFAFEQGAREGGSATDPRAADLVARMTLEEKVHQMQNAAPAIPRLGIPSYEYWNEALHGVARGGEATIFPQAIGMAATWDKELLLAEGSTIGVEGRARYNQAQREGNHDRYFGLTFWAPNINIFRDPRWGRGQETLGEDPFLTGTLATEFVRGIQGDDPRYLQAIATPKHFAVHSGPEPLRHGFNVDPSPRDLNETYLPAFRRTVVEGHAHSLMCSYNAIDGKPACANPELLTGTLRGDWKFDGFVTSDCGAIDDITRGHHFTKTNVEGAAAAVRAGTDTACAFRDEYLDLSEAVRQHVIPESELDKSLQRLFTARMRLGLFDPPDQVPFSSIPIAENHSPAHRELALRAARESIVLLANDGLLPLGKQAGRIAVIGPSATSLIALEGNYKGTPTAPVLPLDGVETAFGSDRVVYAQGAPFVSEIALPVPRTVFGAGLKAEFFNGVGFSGAPVATRTDRQIDFDWNAAAPHPGVNPNAFSVRWTGTLTPPAAGDYSFEVADRRCDPSEDHENYTLKIEGADEFRASSTCEDFGRPRPRATLHFAAAKPRRFTFEYTHQSPRFSAGVTLAWQAPEQILLEEALLAARSADVVVAFVGLVPWLEGEEMPVHIPGFDGGDRTTLSLPDSQTKLLTALASTGKPLVIVLETGSAVALGPIGQRARAIVQAWYGGERGGQAIGEVLSGAVSPSGRLPVTFYASTSQLPAFAEYSMQGRTYRYFTGKPEYPFGHGSSYTRFAYSDLQVGSADLRAGSIQKIAVSVRNTGAVSGAEVIQLYVSVAGPRGAPLRSLKGYERVELAPGQTKTVRFELSPRDLALAGDNGRMQIVPADYRLWVGGGQPDTGAPGLRGQFAVTGSKVLEP
ncbi:MAG: beta-glucosidase [Gammaproteobacteria bacterium]|jgi:beta-glucosidase|nr:beta-glucosidase [Gammaproteobacteria bacterium]